MDENPYNPRLVLVRRVITDGMWQRARSDAQNSSGPTVQEIAENVIKALNDFDARRERLQS